MKYTDDIYLSFKHYIDILQHVLNKTRHLQSKSELLIYLKLETFKYLLYNIKFLKIYTKDEARISLKCVKTKKKTILYKANILFSLQV